ncbi:MAG: response regulator [Thermoplasmatota archaeon]
MKRIMVVDDEKDQVFSIKKSMEAFYGDTYEIIPIYSGPACLDYIEQGTDLPDLIILDIMMQEMNGLTVYKQLKDNKKTQDIPIIFLTAGTCDHTNDIPQAFCIEKPISAEELKQQIDIVLK